MNTREKRIAVILFIVIAVWLKGFLFHSSKKDQPAPMIPGISMPVAKAAKEKDNAVKSLKLEDVLARSTLKTLEQTAPPAGDPFQKFVPPKKSKANLEYSDLNLAGILWQQNEPVALINEEILKTGDTIAGFTVESIKQDEVVISRGIEKHVLKLFVIPRE